MIKLICHLNYINFLIYHYKIRVILIRNFNFKSNNSVFKTIAKNSFTKVTKSQK